MDERKQYVVDALSIDESWRIFRIISEFVEAIETLSGVRHAVSIFGSARTKPDDPYYPGSWKRPTRGLPKPEASPSA
jgi:hypothetical protein